MYRNGDAVQEQENSTRGEEKLFFFLGGGLRKDAETKLLKRKLLCYSKNTSIARLNRRESNLAQIVPYKCESAETLAS